MAQTTLMSLICDWDRLCRIHASDNELNRIESLIEDEVKKAKEFSQEEIELMECTGFNDLISK